MVQEKFFTLHHCWVELKHDKKQNNRYVLDVPKQMKGHGCYLERKRVREKVINFFTIGLNKYGIKQTFNLPSTWTFTHGDEVGKD
jgi:hypothetical protein